jgi:DNA-binding GntR family transcriptional regulator
MSVYDLVKQSILNGELAQGQQLREVALAEQFSVSRTPVREALNRLEQDGLAVREARGLVVREWRTDEVLDIYEVRRVLEAMAARTAADRRTDHDLRMLDRIVELSAEITQSDYDAMRINNQQFHQAVWNATHNYALLETLQRLYQFQHLGRQSAAETFAYPNSWSEATDQHRELVLAIRDRNAASAEEVASGHILRAQEIRTKLIYTNLPES